MNIELKEHFTYLKLARFTTPSILAMIFISVYSIVDGFFVANFAGTTPFAALNIVWPFVMILGSIGFMFGTGGSALVAKISGEGKPQQAKETFSLIVYAVILIGIIFAVLGMLFLKPLLIAFGIDGLLLEEGLVYGHVLSFFIPLFMLQYVFNVLLVTAERPKLSFWVTFLAGVTNVVFDALFLAVFHLGLVGAAYATVLGFVVGGILPLIYFIYPNKSKLRLGKTHFDGKALLKACTNGVSEFMSTISISVVFTLYNYQMLKYIGESGVVAYGIIAYICFIFLAVFIGYSNGCAPIISYHYGAQNKTELKSLFHKNLIMIAFAAVLLTLCAEIFAEPLSKIFIRDDAVLLKMTVSGFRIYAISFLLSGFTIYASALFTALNNGIVSATIATLRTLFFECTAVLIMPILFGISGVWSAIIVAEFMAVLLSIVFFVKLQKRYGY